MISWIHSDNLSPIHPAPACRKIPIRRMAAYQSQRKKREETQHPFSVDFKKTKYFALPTTGLGKSCSFGLPRVPFVNCRHFMYLVISLWVLRAGCGIWLYQFLIIAYLFTLHGIIKPSTNPGKYCRECVYVRLAEGIRIIPDPLVNL